MDSAQPNDEIASLFSTLSVKKTSLNLDKGMQNAIGTSEAQVATACIQPEK